MLEIVNIKSLINDLSKMPEFQLHFLIIISNGYEILLGED